MSTNADTVWLRVLGFGDANGAYLITGGGTWSGSYPSGASASTTILPVLAALPAIPGSRIDPLAAVGADSTIEFELVLDADYSATLATLWRSAQPDTRAAQFIGISGTSATVDDGAALSTGIAWIGPEAVNITNIAGDTITITRAQVGTYARRHAARSSQYAGQIGAAISTTYPGAAGAWVEYGRGSRVMWRGIVSRAPVRSAMSVTLSCDSLMQAIRHRLYQPQEAVGWTRATLIYRGSETVGDAIRGPVWYGKNGRTSGGVPPILYANKLGVMFNPLDGDPGATHYAYVIGDGDKWIILACDGGDPVEVNGANNLVYALTLDDATDILCCGEGMAIVPLEGVARLRHAASVVSSINRVQVAAVITGNLQFEEVLARILGSADDTDGSPLQTAGLPAAWVQLIPPSYRGTGIFVPPNAGFAFALPPTIEPYKLMDPIAQWCSLLGLGLTHDDGEIRLIDWRASDTDLAVELSRITSIDYEWERDQTKARPVLAVQSTMSSRADRVAVRVRDLGSEGSVTAIDARVYVSVRSGLDALANPAEYVDGGWLFAGRSADWYDPIGESLVDMWGASRPIMSLACLEPTDLDDVRVGQIVTVNASDPLDIPLEDGTMSTTPRNLLVIEVATEPGGGAIALRAVDLGVAETARWEPSAKVVSFNAGTGVVTVEANEFTSTSFAPTSDAAAFSAVLFEDLLLRDSTGATLDQNTLGAIGTNTLTISGWTVDPVAGNFLTGKASGVSGPITVWADTTLTPSRYP